MGSGKKGVGKISGKYPVSLDDNMIQGLREMNLDARDSGDWLMINNESSVRARNHLPVSANQPPKACGRPALSRAWGQPAMLGRPRSHDQVSWGVNFHNPTAGFMPRPPNFVGNSHNGMMIRNPEGLPPWGSGHGFNADGIRSNSGSKRPLNAVDFDFDDDDDDDEEEEEEEDEEADTLPYAKIVTKSKVPTKGSAHQSLKSDLRGPSVVGSKPYMSRNHEPSAVPHPGVGYYGWRPGGGGVMPPFPAPHFPPPPLRSGGNFAAEDRNRNSEKTGDNIHKKNSFNDGDDTEFDDEFDDEDLEWEDDDTHKSGSAQNRRLVHGQVGRDPRVGMAPQFQFIGKPSHGGGGSQREAYCNPPYMNGKRSSIVDLQLRQKLLMESYIKNHLSRDSRNVSGATSCETRVKNAGKEVEFISESESSEIDDDEVSDFHDNANEVVSAPRLVSEKREKSGKHMEEIIAIKQISKIPKDEEAPKKSQKLQVAEYGETIDVSAGKQLQTKAEKGAEQANVHFSFFEDYKNRVKEVAKLVKFHIAPKLEADTCAAEKEQLMKIQEEKLEMKKKHLEEEQELEKQFAVALRRFVEKQTTVIADSDASSEL